MKKGARFLFHPLAAALLMLTLLPAVSAAAYPERVITIVVHSKAGSGIDLMSRKLAQLAAAYTEVPLIVENHTGGSGAVAMRKVLEKPADGYTLLAVTKSFLSTALLTSEGIDLHRFYFLAGLISDPEALIVNTKAEINDFSSLLADARAHPGRQKWLGPFVGGTDHLMAVRTWDILGIKARWIPYDSGSEAIAGILGRHGVVYVGNPVDVRGRPDLKLAVLAAPQRLPAFPDVPTFQELGYDLEESL